MTRPHKSARPGAAPRTRTVAASDPTRASQSGAHLHNWIFFFLSFFLSFPPPSFSLPETCLKTQVKTATTCTLKSECQVSALPWPRCAPRLARTAGERVARTPRAVGRASAEGCLLAGGLQPRAPALQAGSSHNFFFPLSPEFSGQVRCLDHACTCSETREAIFGARWSWAFSGPGVLSVPAAVEGRAASERANRAGCISRRGANAARRQMPPPLF